jgi:hypothetical protein
MVIMRKRKKMTDAELERDLKADAGNPDAWEFVTTVPASESARPARYERSKERAKSHATPAAHVRSTR